MKCICNEQKKRPVDRNWIVLQRRCNYSAFNGCHWTPSRYSQIECLTCGMIWRTKANYVNLLKDYKIIGNIYDNPELLKKT